MTLGANIYARRRALDMTQGELGSALGFGQSQVSKWERNKQEPKALSLPLLAETLRISLEDLLTRDLSLHGANGQSPAADSQPQQEARHHVRQTGAASSGVQSIDFVLVKNLENAARIIASAIARAKGERVPKKDARARRA